MENIGINEQINTDSCTDIQAATEQWKKRIMTMMEGLSVRSLQLIYHFIIGIRSRDKHLNKEIETE